MFCMPKNYDHIVFEKDYTQNGTGNLLTALKALPKLSTVSQSVKEHLLMLAEHCDCLAMAYGSRVSVSVDKSGDVVRFLMIQRRFGAFLPQASGLPEMLSLATAFVATPLDEEICITIDFALTDSLSALLLKQAQQDPFA